MIWMNKKERQKQGKNGKEKESKNDDFWVVLVPRVLQDIAHFD